MDTERALLFFSVVFKLLKLNISTHHAPAQERQTNVTMKFLWALERNLMTINFWLLLADDDDESDR